MRLTVDHTTRYSYDQPVRGVVQSHRLQPSRFDGQTTVDWHVTVTGGVAGGGFRDGAGDFVQGWSVAGPVTAIEVHVTGTVDTIDLSGVLRGHKELIAPEAYLRPTDPTLPDARILQLATALRAVPTMFDAAHGLAETVADAIAYRPGTTHAHTTAAQALAQGEGVCQDHAHAMIAIARAADIPARYVSGYLHSGADGSAHEAAHAWAELYVDGYGWIGFDPANRCCPDARYIRLGSGLDAQDAAPIRGVSRGQGVESLDVTVAVQSQEQ